MIRKRAWILLLGGGYALSRLAHRLPAGSFVITSRDDEKVAAFRNAGMQSEAVDLLNPTSLKTLFERHPGLRFVVDSVPPASAPGAGDPRTTGIENLLLTIPRAGIERLFYLSTSGVSGVEDGSPVDERTVSRPRTVQACLRAEHERIYATNGIPFTAIRLPAIYGPGRGIGLALRDGRYFQIEGARWSNRIHVEDLVAVLRAAIERAERLPPLLYVADDLPALASEVVDYYCRKFQLGRPATISVEEARLRGLHTMLANQRVSNRLMKETLGLQLKFPSYREGAGCEFEDGVPPI